MNETAGSRGSGIITVGLYDEGEAVMDRISGLSSISVGFFNPYFFLSPNSTRHCRCAPLSVLFRRHECFVNFLFMPCCNNQGMINQNKI